LTIENIQEYQKNFENNPAIKQYYEIMKEMANADYEAIRIEKTVYVNETVAEYTARYEKSKKTMNDFKDSKLTEEIRDRISDDIVSVTMKS
jgi:hypothetical protein